jgi:hypothetical protein
MSFRIAAFQWKFPAHFARLPRSLAIALTTVAWICGGPVQAMVTVDTIVITNTGATNLIGYRVLISRDGNAHFASGKGSGDAMLPAPLHERLARDLAAAKPLAALPVAMPCAKPVSLGSSTFLWQGAERSADLNCPGNAVASALKNDIDAIVAFLKIGNVPRSQGHELPVQNF